MISRQDAQRGRPLGRLNRIVAGVLAIVWLAGGAIGTVLGIRHRYWPLIVLGPAAIVYGAIWARVAWTGYWLNRPR